MILTFISKCANIILWWTRSTRSTVANPRNRIYTIMITAEKIIVDLGNIQLEVYQLETGEYRLSRNQIFEVVDDTCKDYPRFLRTKKLNTIPCMCLKLPPIQVKGFGKFNPLTIEQAAIVWGELAKEGNLKAFSILIASTAEAIERRADTVLGVKRTEEERQERFTARQGSIDAFWQLGESIEIYKPKHMDRSDNYRKFLYSNCQDRINRGLFGKPARTIRTELKLPDHVLLRDHYNTLALSRLDKIQELASVQIVKQDLEPQDSVKFALETFDYKVIGYAK